MTSSTNTDAWPATVGPRLDWSEETSRFKNRRTTTTTTKMEGTGKQCERSQTRTWASSNRWWGGRGRGLTWLHSRLDTLKSHVELSGPVDVIPPCTTRVDWIFIRGRGSSRHVGTWFSGRPIHKGQRTTKGTTKEKMREQYHTRQEVWGKYCTRHTRLSLLAVSNQTLLWKNS